jgi:Periplasmic component of the Tol biopolymer transport system
MIPTGITSCSLKIDMMKKNILHIFLPFVLLILISCDNNITTYIENEGFADIFPDYIDVTVPVNIAPLNFKINEQLNNSKVVLETKEKKISIESSSGEILIPAKKWEELVSSALETGKAISISIFVKNDICWTKYKPFDINVSPDSIDPYIVYRLIEPGYESWGEMGIYQRDIESYKEAPVLENSSTEYGCMNCHSFCNQNPDRMLFHLREKCTGTIITDGKNIEKLNTSTKETISPLVYPFWHPGGRYVAFSNNITRLTTLSNDSNRVEVYDSSSDVVVYDTQKHEIVTTPLLFTKDKLETFPTFSADGKSLFFCSADSVKMPDEFKSAKYSLCAISFDPGNARFGNSIDTLYNSHINGRSVSFPRVSPNGKYLLYALANYGNFSIWHKDSDLKMLDLSTKQEIDISNINSDDAESYHSWSSNGRWVMFNSRRINGLYTHVFFAHVNDNGTMDKPFLLPQRKPDFYDKFMKSYNIPEFTKDKIKIKPTEFAEKARTETAKRISFKLQE